MERGLDVLNAKALGENLRLGLMAGCGVRFEHLAGDLGVARLVGTDQSKLVAAEDGNEPVEEDEEGNGDEDEGLAEGSRLEVAENGTPAGDWIGCDRDGLWSVVHWIRSALGARQSVKTASETAQPIKAIRVEVRIRRRMLAPAGAGLGGSWQVWLRCGGPCNVSGRDETQALRLASRDETARGSLRMTLYGRGEASGAPSDYLCRKLGAASG